MSKTPRTDARTRKVKYAGVFSAQVFTENITVVDASFARLLETELVEAQSKIKHFEKVAERMAIKEQELKSDFQIMKDIRDELVNEYIFQKALLKQCLEALELTCGRHKKCNCSACRARKAARKELDIK